MRIFTGISSILLFVLSGCASVERLDSEIPMYNGNRSPLVEDGSQEGRNKQAKQSRELSHVGWEYFYQADFRTAMKRFNQAWLLDPGNPEAWWGFGVIMGMRAEENDNMDYFRQAIGYLEKALTLSDGNPKIVVDLAITRTKVGRFSEIVDRNNGVSREEFNAANALFGRAREQIPDYPPLWLNWAYLKYYETDFDAAERYLDKARHFGAEPPKKFLRALEKARAANQVR